MTTAPKFSKLGPGTLKFGETGDEREFASACSKAEIKPEMKTEDSVPLLGGETYKPEGEVEGSISGTFYQEFGSEGLVAWCWANAGKTTAFLFKPSNNEQMEITGKCQISPVAVGGDPAKYNTTDFEFGLVGMPKMTFGTGADD